MKTFLPFLMVLVSFTTTVNAQHGRGLVFNDFTLKSGDSLQLNSVYLFHKVKEGTDATVTISELIGGATVITLDDNSGGLGYLDAFQPRVSSPSGAGQSYATFTIAFFKEGTEIKQSLDTLRATALDIDGGDVMKEFAEIDMNGGVMSYLSSTLDINVLEILSKKFRGENVIGIERDGIDTSAMGNMFTVTQTNVSEYQVSAGTNRIDGAWGGARQFSFFMKGFDYVAPLYTLPVDMISFSAVLTDAVVNLSWVTNNEKNVDKFVVERSTNGKAFTDIGIVFAYGNTHSQSTYQFPDKIENVKSPVVYYRLRSTDIDGKMQYSEIRMVRLTKLNAALNISCFPNPATAAINVSVPSSWQGKAVTYQVLSFAGQAMLQKMDVAASQTENFDVSRLPKGSYMVRASCGNETANQKLIIN